MEDEALNSRVEKWLLTQGYPLEFKVANELIKNGFEIIQSEYYSDIETGKNREIDLLAYKQIYCSGFLIRFSLVIECKSGTSKPWILFTSENKENKLSDRIRTIQTPSTNVGNSLLDRICMDDDLINLKIFSLDQKLSHGITQGFTEGEDIPFKAINSAVKATAAFIKKEETARPGEFCDILFPMVIIEAPLFDCKFDEKLILIEVDKGTMAWRNKLFDRWYSLVKIERFDYFKSIISTYSDEIDKLLKITEEKYIDYLKDEEFTIL